MKLEVIGKEAPEGYQIEVSMNGELNLKYVPQLVNLLLDGIACHGKDVEIAVLKGMFDFMDKCEKT